MLTLDNISTEYIQSVGMTGVEVEPLASPLNAIPKCKSKTAPAIVAKKLSEDSLLYTISLDHPLGAVAEFVESVFVLTHVRPTDEVEIVLRTPGGSVWACAYLLTGMEQCKAPITTVAAGDCASCGAMILSHGDKVKILDWGEVMYHSCLSCVPWYEKSLTIADNMLKVVGYVNHLVKPALEKGLLTEEEYREMNDQKKDIFIPANVMQARVALYNAKLEEANEEDIDV